MHARRLAVCVTAIAIVGLAPFGSGAVAADKCKKLKETKGCALPYGASYFKRIGENNEMQVWVEKPKSYLNVRSNCLQDRSKRFYFKARPKVGKTYKFSEQIQENVDHPSGQTVVYTYKVDLSVTFVSSKKATTKGRATITAPPVPPADNFQGEDAFSSDCDLKRTLSRVKA